MPQNDVNIFIAYSREDTDLLSELKTHLVVLERTQNVKVWYDGLIEAGMDWQSEIKEALHSADIILLLISADFIASDYCYEQEMTQALDLHKQGKVIAIPIILRECLWHRTPFAKLQALPKDGRPVVATNWDTPERPYVQIVEALEDKIEEVRKARQIVAAKQAEFLDKRESKRKFEEAVIAGDEAKEAEKWKLAKQHYELAASYHNESSGLNLNAILEKVKACDNELEYSVNYNLAKKAFEKEDFKSVQVYAEKAASFKLTDEVKSLIEKAQEALRKEKKPILASVFSNRKLLYGSGGLISILILTFIGINVINWGGGVGKPAFKKIKDFENNTHLTVQISDLYWMTENLSTKTSPSWCYTPGEECNNYFGRFYTWESAQKACPGPFRLPSRADWSMLKSQYKTEKEGFTELTMKGRSGFEAVLNGYGVFENNSGQRDIMGHYWTSETDNNGNPYHFTFDNSNPDNPKIYEKAVLDSTRGFSCRCVVDKKTVAVINSDEFKKAQKGYTDLFLSANKLYADKDYKSAQAGFLKAIDYAGDFKHLPIDVSKARTLAEECGRLLGENTSDLEAEKLKKYNDFMFKANSYFKAGDYGNALENYQNAENVKPGDKAALEGIKEAEIEIAGSKPGVLEVKPGTFIHPRGFKMKTIVIKDQEWLVENLTIKAVGKSSCYDLATPNCRRYGELYPYEDAKKLCSSLGSGWRLPSSRDWTILAELYGGLKDEVNKGKVYNALTKGESKMNLLLGGYRNAAGKFFSLNSNGYYWSSTPKDGTAYYLLLRGNKANLVSTGDKKSSLSCRCVRSK